MSTLTTITPTDVLNACTGGAGEAAEALSRALDLEIASITPGEPQSVSQKELPEDCNNAGLIVLFLVGEESAALLLPKSTGLVPAWCDNPDPTGKSKMSTLAQELGMILLPETVLAEDFKSGTVNKLAGGVARGQLAPSSHLLPLAIETKSGQTASAYLVWTMTKPSAIFGAPRPAQPSPAPQPAAPQPAPAKPEQAQASPAPTGAPRVKLARPPHPGALPQYTKNLLKIEVPVSVTLAHQPQRIDRILSIGPGSIIQFDKSCEDMLDLEIGDLVVATGEAVKVGEKFGLRVSEISLPEERFHSLGLHAAQESAKKLPC